MPYDRRRGDLERSWSTRAVPERERFAYWREVVCAAFLDLRPERRGDEAFAGSVRSTTLGPMGISAIASRAQRVLRSEREIDASPEASFYVTLQLEGTGAVHQGGREAHLRPGDFALFDVLRPYELAFEGTFAQLCLALPHAVLGPRLPAPGAACAVRVAGDGRAGHVAASCMHAVARCADEPDGDAAAALVEHLAGLVALAVRGAAPPPATSPGTAALLHLALDDIERHLPDPSLTPTAVAARISISTRYLHKLFAAHGVTFGRWVLRRRLEACARDLADPSLSHWRIADVATRWGFADAAHFSRAFRARFDRSPREHRTAAPGAWR